MPPNDPDTGLIIGRARWHRLGTTATNRHFRTRDRQLAIWAGGIPGVSLRPLRATATALAWNLLGQTFARYAGSRESPGGVTMIVDDVDVQRQLANCAGLVSSPSFEIHTLAGAVTELHERLAEGLTDLARCNARTVDAQTRIDDLETRLRRLEQDLWLVRDRLSQLSFDLQQLISCTLSGPSDSRGSRCP